MVLTGGWVTGGAEERPPRRLLLIFDGRCGVCTRAVRLLEALDRKRSVTAVPYQKPGVAVSAGLTLEDCRSAAWAVTPDGGRYRGAEAVNVALSVSLRTRLPHALYKLPLVGWLQDRAYSWVADNRRRLPGDVAHCAQHRKTVVRPTGQGDEGSHSLKQFAERVKLR